MPSVVDSAVVTRDAALAVSGYESIQSKGMSGKGRGERLSIAEKGLLKLKVDTWVPL